MPFITCTNSYKCNFHALFVYTLPLKLIRYVKESIFFYFVKIYKHKTMTGAFEKNIFNKRYEHVIPIKLN